ncbi:hypothetical protein NPIL_94821 [Nephila pilipes]|uniref:Uncharacterized protein n=1 Tax=Nephila pilipes TaxID=299642 RepID=A0A8X6QA04_NEPPI|nr:hypothetical protein NPIL_94821 [Nephila pilipes]
MPTCKSISTYKKRDKKIRDTKLTIRASTHQSCRTPTSIKGFLLLSHLCGSVLKIARSISTGRDFSRGPIEILRHREAADNSISTDRKRPSREISSAVESGCNGRVQWITVLPSLLLEFHAIWKEDLQATTAEMIYGAPIKLPGEFLCTSK